MRHEHVRTKSQTAGEIDDLKFDARTKQLRLCHIDKSGKDKYWFKTGRMVDPKLAQTGDINEIVFVNVA